MKYIFAALLCAVVLVSACNAACGFFPAQKSENGGDPKGCLYENEGVKEWVELGGSLKRDCMWCNCFDNGDMQCCSDYSSPGCGRGPYVEMP